MRRGTRQDPPKKVITLHCAVDITTAEHVISMSNYFNLFFKFESYTSVNFC